MKKSTPSRYGVPLLATLSALIVFVYNAALEQFSFEDGEGGSYAGLRGGGPTWFTQATPGEKWDKRRKLEIENYMDKRIMEVMRDTWPECVNQKMSGQQCKSFIDDEILSTFTGRDKYIRVILRTKRRKGDSWYNSVVITMDDMDMAVGLDGDGQIEYNLVWEGTGVEVTPEQESDIPPVLGEETEAGTPAVQEQLALEQSSPTPAPSETALDPVLAAQADPTSNEYEPLILYEEPLVVEGATVEGALLESNPDTNPIAGGYVIDSTTPNEPEGEARLQDAIADSGILSTTGAPTASPTASGASPTPGGETTTTTTGTRSLPPFDCSGMTAYNCCLYIKLKVRDADAYGNAIQCQLMYADGSSKDKYQINMRGKKVFVFTTHQDLVRKIPKIVGNWPPGVGEFGGWLEDGGDPNRTDWIPPENVTRV